METDNKEILINNDSKIINIQTEFSTHYPFLKIEFLVIDKSAKTLKSAKIDSQTYLKHLASIQMPVKINIDFNRTVVELSHELENMFGVIVNLYRKSGNVWNVVSISNGWTLRSQNSAGEFICSEMAIPVAV